MTPFDNFICTNHMHHAYYCIIYSPKIYNLHYSNSPGYQNFFLEFRSSSFRMTFQFRHLQFGAFVSNFYAEFLRIKFKLGRFSRLCFDYFELSFEKKNCDWTMTFFHSFKGTTFLILPTNIFKVKVAVSRDFLPFFYFINPTHLCP